MRSSSHSRKLGAFAVLAGATILGLYACSSSSDGGTTTTLPDGAIVGSDGQVITDPDAIAANDSPTDSASSLVNVSTNTLSVAGDSRTYVLSVPKTYDASKAYPLIIALAGDGESADSFRASLGFDAITGNEAITAYPDSVDNLFDDYAENGDQQLVEATIADVKGKLTIDQSKIWGFGYSKGGYMLNQLQCLRPNVFNAIAAHATGGPADVNGNLPACGTESTTAILETKGSLDTNPDPGADGAAAYWAQQNGCAMTSTASTPSGCVKYDSCPAGKQVEYCLAAGVMHLPIWDQATAVSWAFFKSL